MRMATIGTRTALQAAVHSASPFPRSPPESQSREKSPAAPGSEGSPRGGRWRRRQAGARMGSAAAASELVGQGESAPRWVREPNGGLLAVRLLAAAIARCAEEEEGAWGSGSRLPLPGSCLRRGQVCCAAAVVLLPLRQPAPKRSRRRPPDQSARAPSQVPLLAGGEGSHGRPWSAAQAEPLPWPHSRPGRLLARSSASLAFAAGFVSTSRCAAGRGGRAGASPGRDAPGGRLPPRSRGHSAGAGVGRGWARGLPARLSLLKQALAWVQDLPWEEQSNVEGGREGASSEGQHCNRSRPLLPPH